MGMYPYITYGADIIVSCQQCSQYADSYLYISHHLDIVFDYKVFRFARCSYRVCFFKSFYLIIFFTNTNRLCLSLMSFIVYQNTSAKGTCFSKKKSKLQPKRSETVNFLFLLHINFVV